MNLLIEIILILLQFVMSYMNLVCFCSEWNMLQD